MKIKIDLTVESLAKLLNQNPEQTRSLILKHFSDLFGETDPDYNGNTVKQFLRQNSRHTDESHVLKIFGRCTPMMLALFRHVYFFGDGDCPNCGHDLVRENETAFGREWETAKCENCKHFETGEPDWDSMSGGKDDY